MEKTDYSRFRNVIIDDLPIKFSVSNLIEEYPKILEEHGITNLEQLFQAYDNGNFNDGRKTGYKPLKGMVEILKNVYLGEPLVADSYLEMKPNGHDSNLFKTEFNNKIRRLGLTSSELFILGEYYTSKIEEDPYKFLNLNLMDIMNSFFNDKDYQMQFLSKSVTFVENIYENINKKYDSNSRIFQHVTHDVDELQNLIFKISVFSNYYKMKNKSTQSQDEVIELLKKELESLFLRKKGLDFQIEVLEGKIESLNSSKGISR